MDAFKKQWFAEQLVRWYRANQRDLPWRRTKDPYHIWVSEIMLQQTRVDTVIPYYQRFLEKFPSIAALAEAPEAELLKAWEGLGYYSRVRNMQIAARTIQEAYGGKMPNTREEISKLRGIGPYTAGAILSIAFGLPEPAVDGNVLRVMSRFFLLYDDIAKASTRVKVEQMLYGIIPEDAAGEFNQGMMDLGATICTPRSPNCAVCPVAGHCAANLAGAAEELPVKSKAKKPRPEERAAYIIEGTGKRQGKIMLRRRPSEGLLARMWELPNELLPFEAQEQFGLSERFYMEAEHIFSHIRWKLRVYVCGEDEIEELLGKPLEQLPGGEQDDRSQQAGTAAAAEAGAAAEAAAAYDADPSDGSPADEEASVIWVSRETWREAALPNVFIRILERYYSERGE